MYNASHHIVLSPRRLHPGYGGAAGHAAGGGIPGPSFLFVHVSVLLGFHSDTHIQHIALRTPCFAEGVLHVLPTFFAYHVFKFIFLKWDLTLRVSTRALRGRLSV